MSEEKHKNALKENEALKKEVSILKEQLSFLFKKYVQHTFNKYGIKIVNLRFPIMLTRRQMSNIWHNCSQFIIWEKIIENDEISIDLLGIVYGYGRYLKYDLKCDCNIEDEEK